MCTVCVCVCPSVWVSNRQIYVALSVWSQKIPMVLGGQLTVTDIRWKTNLEKRACMRNLRLIQVITGGREAVTTQIAKWKMSLNVFTCLCDHALRPPPSRTFLLVLMQHNESTCAVNVESWDQRYKSRIVSHCVCFIFSCLQLNQHANLWLIAPRVCLCVLYAACVFEGSWACVSVHNMQCYICWPVCIYIHCGQRLTNLTTSTLNRPTEGSQPAVCSHLMLESVS